MRPSLPKIKHIALVNPPDREVAHLGDDTPVGFIPMDGVGIGRLERVQTKPLGEIGAGYTYFRDGDVILAKITPSFENGKGAICSGLPNGIGFGTTELHVLRPIKSDAKFLWYLMHSKDFMDACVADMKGVAGQQRFSHEVVREWPVRVHLADERSRIAAFLDHHTARIDALIAKKRRLLELLEEKRQALVSRAVTRGLNERAPMKESGVPWVGRIPAQWSLSRLKHVSRAIIDTEHKTALPTTDGEYPIVRTSDVKKGELLLDKAQRTDRATYLEWTKRAVPEPGDLVFTREAPAGEVGIIPPGTKLLIGQRTVLIKIDMKAATPDYVLLAMQSPLASEFIQDASRGSTVPHFNMEDVRNIPLLVPPKPEQVSLVEQVTSGAKRIGAVQERIQAGIDLLEEKRSALITAAVTGQLDVSAWTLPVQGAPA